MKWVSIGGGWRRTNKQLEEDVRKATREVMSSGNSAINAGKQNFVSNYFWRTYTGAELDYLEEKNGTLYGFEFKSGSKIVKVPSGWLKAYPKSKFQCVNKNNYLDFILG